jgi:hypothetical protein
VLSGELVESCSGLSSLIKTTSLRNRVVSLRSAHDCSLSNRSLQPEAGVPPNVTYFPFSIWAQDSLLVSLSEELLRPKRWVYIPV